MAPDGTVTDREVVEAVLTVASIAPKKTMLFAGVVLKLVPVTVMVAPTLPEVGEIDEMVGWANEGADARCNVSRQAQTAAAQRLA